MLDSNQHQGKFGEDYVRVLASAAGLLVLKEDLDCDGIDIGFRATGRYGRTYSPMIEAQVKTWSKPVAAGGRLHYRGLDEVQFNQLAGADFCVPRYLFLVCVPPDWRDYASSGPEGVLLRHLGYYVSLRADRRIAQPRRRQIRPIDVPTANVLTAQVLRRLTESPTEW